MTDDETLQKALKSAHFNTDDRQMREIDMAMRNQTNEIQNQIVKYVPYKSLLKVPKFSDSLVWANSADPDQHAPRGAV